MVRHGTIGAGECDIEGEEDIGVVHVWRCSVVGPEFDSIYSDIVVGYV